MEDHLKSYLVIESASILAKKNGIPIFVKKKGNLDAGIIFVIIDTLDGEVKLFRRNLNYVIEYIKTMPVQAKREEELQIGLNDQLQQNTVDGFGGKTWRVKE